jgi:hypothetical protein
VKQMDVLLAVKALVAAALPAATIRGFDGDTSEPETIDAGGTVIGFPGDPGEAAIDLSPIAYNYDHEIELQIAAPNGEGGAALVAMVAPIGAAVEADRTLGGLCFWLDVTAAAFRDQWTDGTTPNWADVSIVASYSTSNPLA